MSWSSKDKEWMKNWELNWREEGFSIEDDPSFEGHDDAWWEKWQRNQKLNNPSQPPRICDGCLYEEDDGSCIIHSQAEQSSVIGEHKCPDKD